MPPDIRQTTSSNWISACSSLTIHEPLITEKSAGILVVVGQPVPFTSYCALELHAAIKNHAMKSEFKRSASAGPAPGESVGPPSESHVDFYTRPGARIAG